MTQEELKLALEELADRFSEGWHEGIKIDASDIMLLSKAAEALAQLEQKPPPWWPAVENILNEYGLQAIDFVAEFKKALAQPEQPQRTWVGLTNNDLQPIAEEYRLLFGSWVHDFARAIEAKLKEKNT